MPPKKKPKRAKSGMKQKQRQTQIVTVNVAIPPRRRRRTKKPASGAGAGAGAPPPSRQQFVQTIYPTTNPLQQDMHFNLASISAQLKNLQDKSVGGVALGSVPTQQQIQLGNPEVEPIRVTSPKEVEPSPGIKKQDLSSSPKKRGPPFLTDIQKQERKEKREKEREKSLTTPVPARPVDDVDKLFIPTNTYGSTDQPTNTYGSTDQQIIVAKFLEMRQGW